MAIYHDAYYLSLSRFAAELKPLLDNLEPGYAGYRVLYAEAMKRYDTRSQIRYMASENGGWDKTVLPLEPPENYGVSDSGLMMTLLLYDQFTDDVRVHRGLMHDELALHGTLEQLGWSEQDRDHLLYGRPFTEFAQRWLQRNDSFWEHLQLMRVGWLDHDDIGRLLLKLRDYEHALAALNPVNSAYRVITKEDAERSFHAAQQMLRGAQEADSDLCLLLSV
jgi:hypothetical protein